MPIGSEILDEFLACGRWSRNGKIIFYACRSELDTSLSVRCASSSSSFARRRLKLPSAVNDKQHGARSMILNMGFCNAAIRDSQIVTGGAGESSIRPVAAAVPNAVFDATGVRQRRALLTEERLKTSIGLIGCQGLSSSSGQRSPVRRWRFTKPRRGENSRRRP
jgi:hypothetical protein